MDARARGLNGIAEMRSILDKLEKFHDKIVTSLGYGDDAYSFDYIAARVLSGSLTMYTTDKSILLVEIDESPEFKSCHVLIAAGELDDVDVLYPALESHARLNACKYVTMTGRVGWARPLTARGWQYKLAIMKKEVK